MILHCFGTLSVENCAYLKQVLSSFEGIEVERKTKARSNNPYPRSIDLETALIPHLIRRGYEHHASFIHPLTQTGYEFDFWNDDKSIAVEILGYRADDEIYKDILKFHVHPSTNIALLLIPRWKWISGKRNSRNYQETQKALQFADSYMSVKSFVALYYDWEQNKKSNTWTLKFIS